MTYRLRGDQSKSKTQVPLSFSFERDSHTHFIFTIAIISCLVFATTREMPKTTVLSSLSTHDNDSLGFLLEKAKAIKVRKEKDRKRSCFSFEKNLTDRQKNKTRNDVSVLLLPQNVVSVFTQGPRWRREVFPLLKSFSGREKNKLILCPSQKCKTLHRIILITSNCQ